VPVVDLAATAAACQPLAVWWRSFEAGAEDVRVLETARRSLMHVTPPPGPVGHAVDVIASVTGATKVELLDAIKLLVRVAGWRGKTARVASRSRSRRGPPSDPDQPRLTGFEAL